MLHKKCFGNRNNSRIDIVLGTLQLERSKLDGVLACYGVDTHTHALGGGHAQSQASLQAKKYMQAQCRMHRCKLAHCEI